MRLLSPSQIEKYQTCPLSWHYEYVEGLVPVLSPDTASMAAGRSMHSALAAYYRSEMDLDAALEALRTSWEKESEGIPPHPHLTLPHLESILHSYHSYYRSDPIRPIMVVEEEMVFEDLGLKGIPDLIVETRHGLEVWDHKTTSGWLGYLRRRTRYSPQLPLYAILASEVLGEEVRAAQINAIYVGERASKKDSKAEKFSRWGLEEGDPVLSDLILSDTRRWLEQIREEMTERPSQIRHPGSHCERCPYESICFARTGRVREGILKTDFKKEERE